MVNVSQDVTPNRASPARIRIARSSNRPDLAQKTDTATQKIKVLTEKIAIQPDGPLSKYTASRRTNPPFRYTKEDKHVSCRTSGAYGPPDRLPARDSTSEPAHIRCILGAACAFWQKEARSARYGRSAIQAGATSGPARRGIGDVSRVAPIRGPGQSGLPGASGDAICPVMFVVTEADAAAIRAIFDQEGELSAAIELRRRFPGITDNAKARACARTIAGWTSLPAQPRPVTRSGCRDERRRRAMVP